MMIRFCPGRKREKSNALTRFLKTNHVEYELIRQDELLTRGTRLYGAAEEPVIEIDGKIFVNPNPQAIRKLLAADPAAEI